MNIPVLLVCLATVNTITALCGSEKIRPCLLDAVTILALALWWIGPPPRSDTSPSTPVVYYKTEDGGPTEPPAYQTDGAGGFDLTCVNGFSVEKGATAFVDTRLCFEIPERHAGFVKGRSSLAKRGLWCYEGLIDSDYRGSVRILLHNTSSQVITVAAGSRIAQMVIVKVERPVLVGTHALSDTERGRGGFGSTDSAGSISFRNIFTRHV